MPSKNLRAFKNFTYNTMYRIFAIIVPLVTTPYLTRRIGASGLGLYGYVYSVAMYYNLFIKLGLNNYGNREIARVRQDKDKLSSTFSEIYVFQFLCGVVVSLVYLFYSLYISELRSLSLILILYVISSGLDITWFFWGMEDFKSTVLRDFIVKILSTIAIFVFVKTHDDTWKYALILSASFLVSQLILWPNVKRYIKLVKPSAKGVIKHIAPNFILFIPSIAVSFYKIMDKIMLGKLSTIEEVGYYESCEKILAVPLSVVESLGTVMQPRVSNLVAKNTDKKTINEITYKSITLMVFLTSVIGFGIMSVADEFVPLFYGKGFDACILLFKAIIPSCLFLSFTNVFKTQNLLPYNKDKQYIVALFTGAVINVVTNALLIPRLDSVGAGIGTTFAEMGVCVVIILFVCREISMKKILFQVSPFVISGVAMYILGQQINIDVSGALVNILIKIVICGAVYFVTLLMLLIIETKVFKFNWREYAKSVLQF